jgi:UDP-N-acetylmuramate dehydrogenase
MPTSVAAGLAEIPTLTVSAHVPLSRYARFGFGGPADFFAETPDPSAFAAAVRAARSAALPLCVMSGGSNLIVSDAGFRGLVLRFTGAQMRVEGERVIAASGAVLQDLVDFANRHGLRGLETLAGIPGWVGAAVYGNAGAYGHSIGERVARVMYFDGEAVRNFSHAQCEFAYRESVFKRHKNWTVLEVELALEAASASELQQISSDIVAERDAKFPSTLKCAGSVFKNLLAAELPAAVAAQVPPAKIREGKIPAAWFLEQAGAKGRFCGGIHVADYHANLIYNDGTGTAAGFRDLVRELKQRVRDRFAIDLEEEVQYVG